MTRIGISGVGSIGARHARVLAGIDGVEVVVFDPRIADPDLGVPITVVGSFDTLLDSSLDGLVIATPDAHHADQAVAACERRLPVLLEKPIADTLESGWRIANAAGSTGTPVLVGYVLHYVTCMQRASALLTAGAIGRPVSFALMLGAYETLVVARSRFETDTFGTLFVDYSHEWDYLRWLVGPVAGGYAIARTAGDLPLTQQPNVVDAVLRLADGTTGTAHLDYVQDPGARRFVIVGDRGTLHVDAQAGTVRITSSDPARELDETLTEVRDNSFRAQGAHFVDVIRGGATPAVTVDDGLAALVVADALRRSVLEARWVDLP
jgi:predicted dehydrogenase